MAESCLLFSQKSCIVDVRMGSEYVPSVNHETPPVFQNSGILINL